MAPLRRLGADSDGPDRIYGSTAADVARGLQLRIDHGTQYLSDHFLAQIRYWGITPSFAFVAQPQTNGVAERFNRTLKEQVIHGRIFRNVEEVRAAVAAFIKRYNAEWLVEKLGLRQPVSRTLAKVSPYASPPRPRLGQLVSR